MDQSLSVYLPVDRRHALATGIPLPEHTQGAALFADIAGFTPLTEALARELGPRRGAEELPRLLNLVYDALIQEVDRYGGSVIGFAGDAITCWFDLDSGLRATACALALQQAIQPFVALPLPSGDTARLALKVAVVSGPVRRFLVGDPRVQQIDTLAGMTLNRMAAAEQIAEKGEVVLDERTAHTLGKALEIQGWRSDEHGARFAVVTALHETIPPQPWPPLPPGTLSADQLRTWLLPTVHARLQAGQGEFLTELRPAVALFLRFGGIDYDSDPEAGQKLDQYIRWVQNLLVQYEGSLLQLTIGEKGSYLYAAFGAPIAHEDDARRAALTALALRAPPEGLSFITETQIGLARGTMRTGAYGSRTRRTYGVLGDEVNLAARLMQVAQPGQIIASGRVQAAAAPLFVWQALLPLYVKGKTDLVPVFTLLGQTPLGERPIQLTEPTYTLPMIGRTRELALLAEKLALTRQGQGQVIGITAEAGIGKSRLVAEAIRLAQAQGFTGYGGECQSYGTHTPYLLWQPIWRAFFGLSAALPTEQQAAQLARAITALDASLLPRLPLLAPVLGLPLADNELTRSLNPELRKASREALLVDLLKLRARRLGAEGRAMLLVLEDCHWLDAASHDLLEVIGHAIWNLPVTIVLAYRPPELEHLAAPRVTTLPYFLLLPLTELSEAEAAHLIVSRLTHLNPQESRELPAALLEHLAARAQGNPFYLEELLNYLYDQALDPYEVQGDELLELPTSLHSLILSRIDRLTEPQKVTLKVASIIGRLFRLTWLLGYYPTLGGEREVRGDLDALSRLDLTPLEQLEPERVYLFKHIVTREVAYESLSYATRAHLHEQLAQFLETQGHKAVESYLDLVAYHYAHSENHAKTREYLRQAGEAAQASYANRAAQAYYERLLPLLKEASEQVEIHLRLGAVLELVGQWAEAERHYQSTLALASRDAQARAQQALGKLYGLRGQYEQAQAQLLQALAQWEMQAEGAAGARQTLAELGVVAWRQGEYEQARDYLEQSGARCQAQGDPSGLAYALFYLASVETWQGNYAPAQSHAEESLALRRDISDKPGIAASLNLLGGLAWNRGEKKIAQARWEESLALRQEIGDKAGIATSLHNLGLVALFQGEYEVAQRRGNETLALRQEMGDKPGIAHALHNLGLVALFQGEYEVAQDRFEQTLLLRREMGEKRGIVDSLNGLGDVAAMQGRYEVAQARFEEGLALRQEMGDKAGIAYSISNLGLMAYRRQERESAQRYYRESLTAAQELDEKALVVSNLVGLAALILQEGAADAVPQALRLLAAVETQCVAIGQKLYPMTQALYDELLAAHPPEAGLATAWAEGQALTLDEAVALIAAPTDGPGRESA